MQIKTLLLPPLDNNTYFYIQEEGVIIVDPASSADFIIEQLDALSLKLVATIFTHNHFDHIGGIHKRMLDTPLYMHQNDIDTFSHEIFKKDIFTPIKDGDVLHNLKVIHTPGHTSGSVCFLDEKNKIMFTGDTMFLSSYGRTDFPTGSDKDMYLSLKKLCSLDPEITIYPGHYETSTIGKEKNNYEF